MSDMEYLRRLEDEYAEIESQRLELDAKEDILRKAIGGLKELSALENRPVVQLIPRATVAEALAALRANYERRANKSNWPDGDDLDWRAAFDLARTELDATIAKLGLEAQ